MPPGDPRTSTVPTFITSSVWPWMVARATVQCLTNVLIWLVALLPTLAISLPFWAYSRFVAWISFGNTRPQLRGIETGFLLEEDTSRSCAAVFVVVSGAHDVSMVQVLDSKFKKAKREFPQLRFTVYPEAAGNYYYWKEKEDWDFYDHWHLLDGIDPDVTYSNSRVMEIWGEKRANSQFQAGKPMWDLYFVPKFRFDEDNDTVDKSCYILSFHHSLWDGISMGKFLNRCLNDTPVSYNPILKPEPLPAWTRLFLNAASIFNLPWISIPMMTRRLWNDKYLRPLTGRKIVCSCKPLDINTVRFIKRKAGCLFSEVIIASVAGALQELNQKAGYGKNGDIRSVISVAFPSEEDNISGNNFSLVTMILSGQKLGPIQRIRDTQSAVQRVRESTDMFTFYWFLKIFGFLVPDFLFRHMVTKVDAFAVISYVPGRGEQYWIGGRQVTDIHFTAQNRDKTGVTVTATSLIDKVRINFQVDEALVGRSDLLSTVMDIVNATILELAAEFGIYNNN